MTTWSPVGITAKETTTTCSWQIAINPHDAHLFDPLWVVQGGAFQRTFPESNHSLPSPREFVFNVDYKAKSQLRNP